MNKLKIFETNYWVWSLREEQVTIGSSILSLKRKVEEFSQVNQEEFNDLKIMIEIVEKTLKQTFHYTEINYLMLMMVDKHVHYHIIPRYNKDIIFENKLWIDFNYPNISDLSRHNESQEYNHKIIEILEKNSAKYISKKHTIGYTTGVFDLFHVGHLNIIRKAKEQCDYLIVGVTTDELVSYKNKKAVISLEDRMEIISGIKYVDKVVIQENMNKMEAWYKYKFDVMFVGSDWEGSETWKNFEKQFDKVGVKIRYIPYTEKVSSTKLRKKIGVGNV